MSFSCNTAAPNFNALELLPGRNFQQPGPSLVSRESLYQIWLSKLPVQLAKQCLGVFEVGRVKAFSERCIERSEQVARLREVAALSQ